MSSSLTPPGISAAPTKICDGEEGEHRIALPRHMPHITTFTAAAVEQLEKWANKVGALFISDTAGSDPSTVAYGAMQTSIEKGIEIRVIDTRRTSIDGSPL